MQTVEFLFDTTFILVQGLGPLAILTIGAFFLSLAIGIVGGTIGASRNRSMRIGIRIYVYIFRSVPFLIFVFLIFYGLPYCGIDVDPYTTAIIALGINHGAYMTEIMRGGLASFDRGQNEAAIALGFTFTQRMRKIVLPQVLLTITPSLVGQSILMVKDTSIISIIGISEVTRLGKEIVVRAHEPFLVFIVVAAIYFAVCYLFQLLTNFADKRVRRIVVGG